jgi:hypothetical protein
MKAILLFFGFFLSSIFADPFIDVSKDVVEAIKQGNAQLIAKNFNDKIDLKILDKEDVYSKAQAELVLKDFSLNIRLNLLLKVTQALLSHQISLLWVL